MMIIRITPCGCSHSLRAKSRLGNRVDWVTEAYVLNRLLKMCVGDGFDVISAFRKNTPRTRRSSTGHFCKMKCSTHATRS